MKGKVFLTLGVLGLLALSSCKKDWECKCEVLGTSQTMKTIENKNRSDAREECEEYTELTTLLDSNSTCDVTAI